MARFFMLDIVVIRRDPDRVRRSARRRGLDPSFVDEVLRLDAEHRSALTAVERAKAEKNRLSAEIGKASDKAAAARELRPQLDGRWRKHRRARRARARALADRRAIAAARAARQHAQSARRFGSGRQRRKRQRRGARVGRTATIRIRRQAALGDRRSARHSRFRTRGQTLGQPLRGAARQRRAALARARCVFPGSRERRGYYGNRAAAAGHARKRCGRPASSPSFPTRCSQTRMPTCS